MVKRSGTIFIIVTVLLLLHGTCFAASRSTKTTSSATPQTTAPTQTSPTLSTSPGTLAPKLKANFLELPISEIIPNSANGQSKESSFNFFEPFRLTYILNKQLISLVREESVVFFEGNNWFFSSLD